MRLRTVLAGTTVVVAALTGVAVADEATQPGPTSDCTTPNDGDRSTQVLSPGSTLNQVSVHLTGDAGPDGVGVHLEPWARRSYFVDAGASSSGDAAVTARVDGDDGRGLGYANAHITSDGRLCASSPTGGVGVTTGATDGDGGGPGGGGSAPALPATPAVARIVAGPVGQSSGYLTRSVTAARGSSVVFDNLDLADHDVRSLGRAPSGVRWFRTPLVGFSTDVPLEFADDIVAGSYPFYCSLHGAMQGTLTLT